MSLTTPQVQGIRESIFTYIAAKPEGAVLMPTLKLLDSKLPLSGDGSYLSYKGNDAAIQVFKLAKGLSPVEHAGAWDALLAELAPVGTSAPPPPPPPPAPVAGTMAPLTASQIAGVKKACDAFSNWKEIAPLIKADMDAVPTVYAYGDANKISAIKLYFYGQVSMADKDAEAYMKIIDQRVPTATGGNSDVTLPIGDPRWKYVSGTPAPATPPPPAPSPVVVIPPPANVSLNAAAVVAALAELGIYVEQNRMGVGIRPDADSGAAITVGGESAAVIDGISNTKGTDGQNPGEVHKSSFVVSDNDGGQRARQYALWKGGVMTRNTTNRPFTAFAFMDSWGDTCISDDRWPKGQVFYLVKTDGSVSLCTYQQGWTIKLKESVAAYGAADKEVVSG